MKMKEERVRRQIQDLLDARRVLEHNETSEHRLAAYAKAYRVIYEALMAIP